MTKKKNYWLLILLAIVTIQKTSAQVVAQCNDTTVFLQRVSASAFSVSINPSEIDDGSSSPLGIRLYSLDTSTFRWEPFAGIDDQGFNTVILTVTDSAGNMATCTSTVTVLLPASPPPQAGCQNITLQLDSSGKANVRPSDIDNGSFSADGIQRLTISDSAFTCSDVGTRNDTLTVLDNNGNTASCISVITVEDTVRPKALCYDTTVVFLDQTGHLFLIPDMIDDSSYDACGIQQLSLNLNLLSCANLGDNTVTLTVTDNNGNTSTCNSIVRVKDFTPPQAYCSNITKILNSNGTTTITPGEVNNGSFDACSGVTLTLNKTNFDCNDIGDNKVILTATDSKGNVAVCISNVTIQNLLPPVAICRNINLRLDKNGKATIIPDEIDNGSHAVCGIRNIEVDKTEFTYADIGSSAVTLTVTDNSGNSETCTATVTVSAQDSIMGRVFRMSNTPVFTTNNFTYIERDANNDIWAGTSGSGVYIYDNGNWEVVSNQFGMSGFIVRAMRRQPHSEGDSIYIGMSKSSPCLGQVGGIYAYANKNNYIRKLPTQNGLHSLVVRSLDFNKETGENWAGCSPDICIGNNGGLSAQQNGAYIALNEGMPPHENGDRFVTALTSDTNGIVYAAVGRSCGNTCIAPYIIKRSSIGVGGFMGTYTGTNTPLPLTTSSSSLAIRALFADSRNRLWVGGELNGIGVLDSSGWHFLNNPAIPYPSGKIVNFDAITEGPDRTIYFGTSEGLLLFKGDDVTDITNWRLIYLKGVDVPTQGPGLQNIGAIRIDTSSNFWMATREGVFYQKNPVVYNITANITKTRLSKRPFKGIEVRAFNGNAQVGNMVTTNDNGEFRAINSQLQNQGNGPFTLKFKYIHNSSDTTDRDFEAVLLGYIPSQQTIDDVLIPARLLRQIREIRNTMLTPDSSFKVFGLGVIVGDTFVIHRKVYNLNALSSKIDSLNNNPIDALDAAYVTENLGRAYLGLFASNELVNYEYEVAKLIPAALLNIVSSAFDIVAARGKLLEARGKLRTATRRDNEAEAFETERAIALDRIEEKLQENVGLKTMLFDVIPLALDQAKSGLDVAQALNSEFFSEDVVEGAKQTIDVLKTSIENLKPGFEAAGLESVNSSDFIKFMFDRVKDVLIDTGFVMLHKYYIEKTQEACIDNIVDKITNIPPVGTFDSAAVFTNNVVDEMRGLKDDILNTAEFTSQNTAQPSITESAFKLGGEIANTTPLTDKDFSFLNYQQYSAAIAREFVTALPLAALINAIFNAGNNFLSGEEALRGYITLMGKQGEVTNMAFNPIQNP